MAARLVGSKSGGSTLTTSSGTSTTGSTFEININIDGGTSISSVTDNKGNTYTRVGSGGTNSFCKLEKYRCENGTGGSNHTATVVCSGETFGQVWLVEVPNAKASSFDVATAGNDGSSPYTQSTGALAEAGEEVILLFSSASMSGGSYASSNMTIIGAEENDGLYWPSALAVATAPSTAAFVGSMTGGSDNGGMMISAYKINAGGASSILKQMMQHT